MYDKAEVDYSPGHPGSKCSLCRFFLADTKTCLKVAGPIEPSYWCRLFQKIKKLTIGR
jgi:hypothetical protein